MPSKQLDSVGPGCRVGCRFERGINRSCLAMWRVRAMAPIIRSYLGMTFATGTFGVCTPQKVLGYKQVIFGYGYIYVLFIIMPEYKQGILGIIPIATNIFRS
jgi:hypothetical protein